MRAFLGLRGARAIGTFGAGENTARREEEDVAVRELLFEFACQTGGREGGLAMEFVEAFGSGDVPLLNFVKTGKEGDWDEDDNRFLAVADFELWIEERLR